MVEMKIFNYLVVSLKDYSLVHPHVVCFMDLIYSSEISYPVLPISFAGWNFTVFLTTNYFSIF